METRLFGKNRDSQRAVNPLGTRYNHLASKNPPGSKPFEGQDIPVMPSPFLEDLQRFGPDATEPVTLEAARGYCARLTASHYENFSVVAWLTPRPLRPAFASI